MNSATARPDDVRRQNRKAILLAIRTGGAMSRTDICAASGLSQATVSAISTDLIAAGILRGAEPESGPRQGRGRPQVLLQHNPTAGLVCSLALTAGGLAIALVDYAGKTLGSRFARLDTLGTSAAGLLDAIAAELRQMIDRHGAADTPLRHITIGIQGATDSKLGRILWSPIIRERNVDFRDALSAAFAVPVTIDNDCNLIAEALHWSSDFPFQDDFAALLLGEGIGMGLYLHGARFHGAQSSAVEFGHMLFQPRGQECRCGALGCIEAYAGEYAIIGAARPEWREAALRGNPPREAFAGVTRAARGGDAAAVDAFRVAGEALGSGLASLFSITDPLPVAVVGDGAAALDLIEPAIHALLATAAVRNFAGDIDIRAFRDERQLVLYGCSMTSLRFLDGDLFARSGRPDVILENVE